MRNLKRDLFSLEGKVAIVTGGAQGLGEAMAIGLAKYGAKIIVADISYEKAQEMTKRNREFNIEIYKLDVTQKKQIYKMVNKIIGRFKKIDILVNSAGTIIRKPVVDLTEKDWDTVLTINLKGTFLCCQAVGKFMIKQRRGKIINIASVSSKLGHMERAAYAASKGGVVQLTKVMAHEWAKYGINVNAISPAICETPLTIGLRDSKEKINKITNKIPIGRLGKPEDLIGSVIYLSSKASDFVTGHNLFVDGGRTID